ncbi:hypothetical protein K469DRAFT_698249 [Zopfia rhizophila CBS 207.26]|uniref:Uncharacterized protein n=1 Tax=Zopfia rhizophila CBS 207.26 TaxID=1314779 RepID=A0A6A6DB00_9PEZI|nr:hypothetical protein K469DRAFT_698249 [Zopfia rhizophila CBS 207.26]
MHPDPTPGSGTHMKVYTDGSQKVDFALPSQAARYCIDINSTTTKLQPRGSSKRSSSTRLDIDVWPRHCESLPLHKRSNRAYTIMTFHISLAEVGLVPEHVLVSNVMEPGRVTRDFDEDPQTRYRRLIRLTKVWQDIVRDTAPHRRRARSGSKADSSHSKGDILASSSEIGAPVFLKGPPEDYMMQANGQTRTPASLQESARFQPFQTTINSLAHDGPVEVRMLGLSQTPLDERQQQQRLTTTNQTENASDGFAPQNLLSSH